MAIAGAVAAIAARHRRERRDVFNFLCSHPYLSVKQVLSHYKNLSSEEVAEYMDELVEVGVVELKGKKFQVYPNAYVTIYESMKSGFSAVKILAIVTFTLLGATLGMLLVSSLVG